STSPGPLPFPRAGASPTMLTEAEVGVERGTFTWNVTVTGCAGPGGGQAQKSAAATTSAPWVAMESLAVRMRRRTIMAAAPHMNGGRSVLRAVLSVSALAQEIRAPPEVRAVENQCKKGVAPACTNAGVIYTEGMGVPRDPAKGVTFFQRA